MVFTGRLGTGYSNFGNIVFGISTLISNTALNFEAHPITSRKIRIQYTFKVDESALNLFNYQLNPISGFAVTPSIIDIYYEDSVQRSVILELSQPLTYTAQYSISIDEIYTVVGEAIVGTKNFTANVQNPPKVIGAYLSKRGFIDLVFDRSVGPTSSASTFFIHEIGGLLIPMTQANWSLENILPNILRIELPLATPIADNYIIEFVDIIDYSNNQVTGSIPLTLSLRSPLPHSLSNLTQLQITDAYVVDVSGDPEIRIGTIRIYFNGPVLDANNPLNWTLNQDHPHKNLDTIDLIVAADAFDEISLVTLVNELKLKINNHFQQTQVHYLDDSNLIMTTDAINLNSAINLLNELQTKYLNHVGNEKYHLYADDINIFNYIFIYLDELGDAISVANLLKYSYSGHLQLVFPLNLVSVVPGVIDEVSSFTRLTVPNNTLNVTLSHIFYADLHVSMSSIKASVNIEATVQSEDLLSFTNPLDYTGNIKARPVNNLLLLDKQTIPNVSYHFYFDKEIQVPNANSIICLDNNQKDLLIDVRIEADYPTLMWCFNNLVFAYQNHILPISPGAIHVVQDIVNTISSTNYMTLIDPLLLFDKINALKLIINNHVTSQIFHPGTDNNSISSLDAIDFNSALILLKEMRSVLLEHNVRPGIHNSPGRQIISAPLYNKLVIETNLMKENVDHSIQGEIKHSFIKNYFNNGPISQLLINNQNINELIRSSATPPCVASVLSQNALTINEEGVKFTSDVIKVWFSKPMNTNYQLNNTNVQITGGSIIVKEINWNNNTVASLNVVNMEPIVYDLTCYDLVDLAGNTLV